MEMIKKKLSELVPADYNPRQTLCEGDKAWEKLNNSMEAFGLVEPIIWNRRTGHIVGGHQRYAILCAQGVEETEVSVVDLPEREEKALNLALNKISGQWDDSKLEELLSELAQQGELALTGFDESELEVLQADYNHIEDLFNEEFAQRNEQPTQFQITFTLPAEAREIFETWLQEHRQGKLELAQLVVQKARGLME